MKVNRGVNPDFADYDEIDRDVEEAIEEFHAGLIGVEQLQALIGREDAQRQAEMRDGPEIDALFDNPEDF